MSGIVGRMLGLIQVPADGGEAQALQAWIFENLFAPLGPPAFASLLYALVWITAWYGILLWMYNRQIFIKV